MNPTSEGNTRFTSISIASKINVFMTDIKGIILTIQTTGGTHL